MSSLDLLIKELQAYAKELKPLKDGKLSARVSRRDLLEVVKLLVRRFQARLAFITGADFGSEGFDIVYVFDASSLKPRFKLLVETRIPRDDAWIPSTTPITLQGLWAEKEIMEFLGIEVRGHPDPRYVWLPYEWPNMPETGAPLDPRRVHGVAAGEGWLPLRARPGSALASLIPIGPYHPSHVEGQYVRLKLDGEVVEAADIKVGFHHRGISRLIERRGLRRGVLVAEKVCGICSGAHGLAYVSAAERTLGIDPPERVLYTRTLLAELNRIQSHLLWLGLFSDVIGFKTGFMYSWSFRERVLDILERLTGNRIAYGVWRVGGVSLEIEKEEASHVERSLKKLKEEFLSFAEDFVEHPLVKARVKGIGVLKPEEARELNVLGPTARASTLQLDVRLQDPPNAAYDPTTTGWRIVVKDGCDCYSRLLVRLEEVQVSLDVCLNVLDYVCSGELRAELPDSIEPGAEGVACNEAPRGELVYYMRIQEAEELACLRIRTPSYQNFLSLAVILKGCMLADVPVIIASIDQCIACTDRVEIMDGHRRRLLTWTDLVQLSQRASKREEN
ncbi:MAG: NADH-quinone oxidoreductase subunit C [Candidatus Verstraetearchaeota archaeon]|nr:NADH-quinone oxidoreductase subunit C [Candidatus Verstraetearchaeota archaeon]